MGVLDELGGSRAPAFKFEKVGDKVTGQIVNLETQQDCVMGKPEMLKWWNRLDDPGPRKSPTDRPVLVLIVTLQTEFRDSDEDDGCRTVYCRNEAQKAFREAVKKAMPRVRNPPDEALLGGTMTMTHSGIGKPKHKGFNGPKLFEATFEPPSASTIASGQPERPSGAHNEQNPPDPEDW